MLLNIFDVDHGACALITTSNNRQILIDCGHNAQTGWHPGSGLKALGINYLHRLYVTHFDEDHVSGLPDLMKNVFVEVLIKNPTVGVPQIENMKSGNHIDIGTQRACEAIQQDFTGGPPSRIDYNVLGDTIITQYCNSYDPVHGFIESNNLSLAIFVKCGPHKILFPGDLEKAGWEALLLNPQFVSELRDVSIFVASHHGRLNGYCEDVMKLCPAIEAIVFSDGGKIYQTQETTALYGKHANGVLFGHKRRYVLTTRQDKSMQFNFREGGGGSVMLNLAA